MLISLLAATSLICMVLAIYFARRYRTVAQRFSSVLSLEDEAERVRKDTEKQQKAASQEIEEQKNNASQAIDRAKTAADEDLLRTKTQVSELSLAYASAKETYDRLQVEVSLLESTSEDMSFGLYKPQFSFQTPEEYYRELSNVYQLKKICIRNDQAVRYPNGWTVNNSLVEGRRMVKKQTKIMLRAFNGECDASIARVTWNNASRMVERIRKSFLAINDLGVVVHVQITDEYLRLCLAELNLTHEYELKKQEQKEIAREDRERLREEERAQKEFVRAQREAAAEKVKAEKALVAAHEALQRASGPHREAIQTNIAELERRLVHAQEKQERAVSMAQLTKMGHVYVISNIGSFGENIFKIGMTRRLEPDDRIYELSGAAVPFAFDVHAMIFSDNAPALEAALHMKFADRRLNLVNSRKEYFRVSLDELSEFANEHDLKVDFLKVPEAKHFRQSEAIRLKALQDTAASTPKLEIFPERLFSDVQLTQANTVAALAGDPPPR